MTLNQVIAQLNEIATNHNQINTFGFNDMPEYGKETSVVYPVMWVSQLPSNINGSELHLKFRILFADLVHKGEENQDDVSSDQMQTALDIIAQLQHPDYEWVYNSISSLEPIQGKLDDSISGWIIDVDLMIDNAYNRCQIPFTPSPTPEVPNGFVTIYDTDGVTILDYVSNNSYYIIGQMTTYKLITLTSGAIDGSNTVFVFAEIPVQVVYNGNIVLESNYTLVGTTVTLNFAPFTGESLTAYGNY